MFTLDDLRQRVEAYADSHSSLREFEDWFELNSWDAYEVPVLGDICRAIDSALSQYYFDDIGERALREELANSVRSFLRRPVRYALVSRPQGTTISLKSDGLFREVAFGTNSQLETSDLWLGKALAAS